MAQNGSCMPCVHGMGSMLYMLREPYARTPPVSRANGTSSETQDGVWVPREPHTPAGWPNRGKTDPAAQCVETLACAVHFTCTANTLEQTKRAWRPFVSPRGSV